MLQANPNILPKLRSRIVGKLVELEIGTVLMSTTNCEKKRLLGQILDGLFYSVLTLATDCWVQHNRACHGFTKTFGRQSERTANNSPLEDERTSTEGT